MSRVNPDIVYDRFLSEAKEENGNFYFVKLFDSDLYERLCRVERSAQINMKDSGSELRNTLEVFMKKAMPQKYVAETRMQNAARLRKEQSNTADIKDYETVFAQHKEIGVDAYLFGRIREVGNTFHHERASKNHRMPPRTYATLCSGLRDMQQMLMKYYGTTMPSKMKQIRVSGYDKGKQPFGDKMVYSTIDTLDSTACEKQVLCSRQDERNQNLKSYYLLRIYRAENASEGAIRDEKVLSSLWGNSLRGIPNIVRYTPLNVEYDGEDPANEKKYIVSYDFGYYKPYILHAKLVDILSQNQRLMVIHDMAAGVKVLHSAGIYHRNLQPNSVFVFFDRDTDFVQAKLVGFEYAKIDGDNATVIGNVVKLQKEDPSAFFSITMKQGLKNRQIASRLDWAKEDIYSLGALFYFVLTGKTPPVKINDGDLSSIVDRDTVELIKNMLDLNPVRRPTINDVMSCLDPVYSKLIE